MDLQIVGELTKTYKRYIFNQRNQHTDESIDEYVTELKHFYKKTVISVIVCSIAYYVISW